MDTFLELPNELTEQKTKRQWIDALYCKYDVL